MAPNCYICKCYDPKKMSLFRIPNRSDEYSERGKVWLQLLNEKKKNINQIRICSLHFLKSISFLITKSSVIFYYIFTGKPSKADDYLDVDWVPNKNLGEYSKNWKSVEYFIRKKNASRVFLQTLIFETVSLLSYNLSQTPSIVCNLRKRILIGLNSQKSNH